VLETFGGRRVDAARLARALAGVVRGEVRFDAAARGAYSQDASNYRQPPIGVVVPLDEQDVVEAVRVCRDHDAPVLGRGGGTSLAGQCCNTAVVFDFTKYMGRVLALDPQRRVARVQPGCVLDRLRAEAAPHGLTFGPDPATHDHCTLGGMIMNNSCGIHSVLAEHFGGGPRTEHQVASLRVLTYDGLVMEVGPLGEPELDRVVAAGGRSGEIHAALRALRDRHADAIRRRFPDIPRRVSGYNLSALLPENGFDVARALCGTEGTCVLLLEATVRLVWKPLHDVVVVLGYPDIATAGDQVVEIMRHKPIGLEAIDGGLVRDMQRKGVHTDDLRYLPQGEAYLLVEFGADDPDDARRAGEELMRTLAEHDRPPRGMHLYQEDAKKQRIWEVRESGLGATAWVPGQAPTWPGWEDAAVPPAAVGDYLRDFQELLDRHHLRGDLYGHFGQGCIHTRIDFDLRSRGGIDAYSAFIHEAADLVVRHGGSLSGEHGDGQARGALLGKMYGEELLQAFAAFKRIWDPSWRMNPGKVVDARPPDQDLLLGTDYNPQPGRTWFSYDNDIGGFGGAAERCVGVGKCRRADGGVMCPSYMVTREEIHSTRGRARLLFEMLRGGVVTGGWKSEAVKEALDLCLACKGCKHDCPVDVDMATYKAEFLAHYYAGRVRPRQAYAAGWIRRWARLAARMPGVVNWLGHARGVGSLAKRLAGFAAERDLPRFAPKTLRRWFHRDYRRTAGERAGATWRRAADASPRRAEEGVRGMRVLLWPDTFNDHFHPDVGRAAVEVLTAAGCRVVMPERSLCCGRPLYDYGFLDLAKRRLAEIVDELRFEIRAGTPIVGLEPSCIATFRDEAPALFPHDVDVRRLAQQSFMLGEFVADHGDAFDLPRLDAEAIVHAHCHYQSVLRWPSEQDLLDRLGLRSRRPERGCCGMAGAFGFERGSKYQVSVAIAERALAPAVRGAGDGTLVVADGFSCREQIRQLSGRLPLHLAHLLAGRTEFHSPSFFAGREELGLWTAVSRKP